MPGIRRENSESQVNSSEALSELIDLDDDSFGPSEKLIEVAKKERQEKATDVRRKIEERLEVRMLRDELGMDDLDI